MMRLTASGDVIIISMSQSMYQELTTEMDEYADHHQWEDRQNKKINSLIHSFSNDTKWLQDIEYQ